MKKMIRASALLLLAVLLCGVLAACAPSLDSEKLETVMTEAGYTVTFGNAELIAADAAAEKSDLHPDWVEPKRFGNIVYYGTVMAVDIAKD